MAQHLGRRRVPQDMCAFGRAHNPSPLHRASHRGGYAVAPLERPIRRNVPNEDVVALPGGAPAREVVQDRISNVLREWQSNLVAPLPRDPQRTRRPLDIADAKSRDVAGSKPEPCQEQNDCSVTPVSRRTAVTCGDQAVDLLRRQIFWQSGQVPGGKGWHSPIQIGLALAADAEISQERTEAGGQLFNRAGATSG